MPEMLMEYTQEKGFQPTDAFNELFAKLPENGDWDDCVEKLGFGSRPPVTVGDPEFSFGATIYYRLDTDLHSWAALFDVELGSFGYLVFVREMHDAIALTLQLQTSFLSKMEYPLQRAMNTLEKAFRAWHGHSIDGVCRDCDPEAVKRRLELAKKREASG